MDITIFPGKFNGTVAAISSKSMAHRLLICAAFADRETTLICPDTNQDIDATADCLCTLGAQILRKDSLCIVRPMGALPEKAVLNCHESGSTLRFLLPIVGALGVSAIFKMEGRLPKRPLSPLWEEMERMGCKLQWISEDELLVEGKLQPGNYHIDGSVSSQFITGLLLATSLLEGESHIEITGKLESKPYVAMSQQVMAMFGVDTKDFHIRGGQTFHSPGTVPVEGDWSNAAFWLAAGALGSKVEVTNLDQASPQGDRAVADLLPKLTENITISAGDIPDLVPILSVVAAANKGAIFTNMQRLRLKESDRVASIITMLKNLGGKAEATEDTLTVCGSGLTGGSVDSCNDHRIAMAAAIASTVCKAPVTISGAECVKKSYPNFWKDFTRLGGKYEQYLR